MVSWLLRPIALPSCHLMGFLQTKVVPMMVMVCIDFLVFFLFCFSPLSCIFKVWILPLILVASHDSQTRICLIYSKMLLYQSLIYLFKGLYYNNTVYKNCQKVKWNSHGEGQMFVDYNIPIFLLTNSSEVQYIIEKVRGLPLFFLCVFLLAIFLFFSSLMILQNKI